MVLHVQNKGVISYQQDKTNSCQPDRTTLANKPYLVNKVCQNSSLCSRSAVTCTLNSTWQYVWCDFKLYWQDTFALRPIQRFVHRPSFFYRKGFQRVVYDNLCHQLHFKPFIPRWAGAADGPTTLLVAEDNRTFTVKIKPLNTCQKSLARSL